MMQLINNIVSLPRSAIAQAPGIAAPKAKVVSFLQLKQWRQKNDVRVNLNKIFSREKISDPKDRELLTRLLYIKAHIGGVFGGYANDVGVRFLEAQEAYRTNTNTFTRDGLNIARSAAWKCQEGLISDKVDK